MSYQKPPTAPPTDEQISISAVVMFDGAPYLAAWYPQIEGYAARAWLRLSVDDDGTGKPNDSFDALVFHDGEFPSETPGLLFHHCSAKQFRTLADDVDAAIAKLPSRSP